MKAKTHEEWMVGFRPKFVEDKGEKTWFNAMLYCPWNYENGRRYARTEEEARRALNYVYKERNGEKLYDENGKRYEYMPTGSIGVSIECTKETDEDQKIVKHIIKKRIVTDWEVIEE